MPRVLIRDKRSGREKSVAPRYAHLLVRLKKAEYVVEEAAQERTESEPTEVEDVPDFDAMSYRDLQALVKEADLETDGRAKDDYVRALRYHHRAMRAED